MSCFFVIGSVNNGMFVKGDSEKERVRKFNAHSAKKKHTQNLVEQKKRKIRIYLKTNFDWTQSMLPHFLFKRSPKIENKFFYQGDCKTVCLK